MENYEVKPDYRNNKNIKANDFTSNDNQFINNCYVLEKDQNHYDSYETVDDVVKLSYDPKTTGSKPKESVVIRQPEQSFTHICCERFNAPKECSRNSRESHHHRRQTKQGGKNKTKHKKKIKYSYSATDNLFNEINGRFS